MHSLSFTNLKLDFRQAGEVGAELLDLASLPDIDKLKITAALVEQVRASTAKSKLQMSRISSLGTLSLSQACLFVKETDNSFRLAYSHKQKSLL